MSVEIQGYAVPDEDPGAVAGSERAGAPRQSAARSPTARRFVRAAAFGGICLLLGAALGVLSESASQPHARVLVTTAAPFTFSGPRTESMLARLVAAVRPSVVSITVTSPTETDLGTGVVVSRDGFILTANHVVSTAGRITVRRDDGRAGSARVVGRAPRSDLALLRTVALRGFVPATFGSAKQLQTGDEVLVIGNPLGLAGTVSRGIVSALHRSVPLDTGAAQPQVDPLFGLPEKVTPTSFLHDAIQTDAVVQPGNSGGPLVDLHGHVIGILCTVASDVTGADPDTGLAFAIPSDAAWATAIQLMGRA